VSTEEDIVVDAKPGVPEALEAVVRFHGHLCPGLLIGYRAALLALDTLEVDPSADEDLILIAENDSCSVDAFQYLLSTTFGKGNLVFLDHGKQVFTVGDRGRDRAVRIALRNDAFGTSAPGATPPSREERIEILLSAPAADLFHLNLVSIRLPGRAEVHKSVPCARCREGVMETRTVASDGRLVCIPCARDLGLSG
jgi:formylmethanofuran dehydrogenase subunit E